MGRAASFDRAALAGLLAKQDGVITRSQAAICAMSEAAVRHRISVGGRWQVLLPGIYLSSTGAPTTGQQQNAGVAGEVDSREWHLSPRDWELTLARHARMSAHGIIVLHFTPRRILAEPMAVGGEIASAILAGRRRPPLPIRTLAAR